MAEQPADDRQAVQVSGYPAELVEALSRLGAPVESLLDWAVRPGEVALVLENGQKVRFTVRRDPPRPRAKTR